METFQPMEFSDITLDEASAEMDEETRAREEERSRREEEEAVAANPVQYAQLQADRILEDANRQAAEILANAKREAEAKANEIYAAARRDGADAGHAEGLQRGMAQALADNERVQAAQAQTLGQDVKQFLDEASAALERQLDENLVQMRDLAIAIAEKVVCVSLKTSEGVIARMIQSAIDKRKRREWVQIYIAECDAKALAQVPPALAASLAALSDRVRIIPISDDESGTCIIEMPDEIIDASASTQMSNIRAMLLEHPVK